MGRGLIFVVLILVQLLFSGQAFAARTYKWSGPGGDPWNANMGDGNCSYITAYYQSQGNTNVPVTCSGLDAALDHVAKYNGSDSFTFAFKNGVVLGASVTAVGSCVAGAAAGDVSLVAAYVSVADGRVLQVVNDIVDVHGVVAGCVVKAVGADFCMTATSDAVDGVAKKTCVFQLQETGAQGGAAEAPDDTVPAYSGTGGSTGTGDTGGTTGTGGTGDTSGTGGTGGTSGTGGTTGTGGTGTGGTNCGAPGEPACKIDESGTPSSIGSVLDALNGLVNGIGSDRQNGLNDATSDSGKDTSLGFGLQLPSGSCTNPTVGLPGIGGQWTVDVCSYISMFAAMFELLWVFFFGYAVMSLVARATAKPVA